MGYKLLPAGYMNMKTARKIHTRMKQIDNQSDNEAVFRLGYSKNFFCGEKVNQNAQEERKK